MSEIQIEKLKALYFNEKALLVQPAPVYRLQSEGKRFYYDFGIDGEPRFYISVTTMLKSTMPTSPHLIKWIADNGYEESQEIAAEKADYGTFMHIQIADFLINREYDLDKVRERLKIFIELEQLPASCIEWEDKIKKDVLAFAQFCIDCDVEPLAIEMVLTNPIDGYAGAIDLVCEMNVFETGFFGEVYKSGVNKGEPKESKITKRVRAIIDNKSGRKGFWEEHEIQLAAYKKTWEHNFPQYPVERLFNWSPKDWRKSPSYNLKDQTDSKNANKLQYLVKLAELETEKRTASVTLTKGKIVFKNGLENNISNLSLADVVKKRAADSENPIPEVTETPND